MPAASLSPSSSSSSRRGRGSRRKRSRSLPQEGLPRPLAGLIATGCLLGALALAWQYPLGALPALSGVLLTTLFARFFWRQWPGWMLGLFPLIGLAPWTGWLLVEEFDLLLLAGAAGGYLAISGPHRTPPPPAVPALLQELRWRPATLGLLALFVLSTLVSVWNALDHADALPGLWDGYMEPGAALRNAKPVIGLMLMLPLWRRVSRLAPQALTPSLVQGLGLALAVVVAGVLHERIAFTGLTNFSSDYRPTGSFWESHVGGAALDGALALLLPFALLGLLRLRDRIGFGVAALLLVLGGYAALVSFSRGLYGALTLGLLVTVGLWVRQHRALRLDGGRTETAARAPAAALGWLLLLVGGTAAVAWALFPTSGYRGLLGLCGAVVALLAQPAARAEARQQRIVSSAFGLLIALPLLTVAALLAWSVDKAAYAVYALLWAGSVALAWQAAQGRRPWASAMGDALRAGLWFATLGCTAVVAWNWGGQPALDAAWPPLAALALAWPLSQGGEVGQLVHSLSWRARSAALAVLLLLATVVAALGGGDYISQRVSTTGSDFNARWTHWSRSVSALDHQHSWLFGAGSGRFPAVFVANAPANEQIGDFRLVNEAGARLHMKSGTHALGWGEMLRLSQRLQAVQGELELQARVRAVRAARLHVEVCNKHLLYSEACAKKSVKVPAQADWQSLRLPLGRGDALTGSGGLVFAVALSEPGNELDVASLSLRDGSGEELLVNGDFDQGLARWFMTSDMNHLPWHAHNLPLHVLFEQGVFGVLVAGSMFLLAMGRLAIGAARDHPLAPALAGGVLGFLLVGLFDSLVDAPRLAFVFLLLLVLSLGLRATAPR